MVLIDSDIWIDYLSGRASSSVDALSSLIELGEAALAGIVLAEVLRGTRGAGEQRQIEAELASAPFVETTREAWRRAGTLLSDLDSKGQPIPVSDVLLAALAIESGHELFSRDKHFHRIPNLRLYDPDKEPSDA